jgi:hypothetical protein
MRNSPTLRATMIALFFAFLAAGCSKDDETTTGKLELSFNNLTSEISVYIHPAENTSLTLYQLTPVKGKVVKNLNVGNYYLTIASQTYYGSTGFQIQAGKTTKIYYTGNNTPVVEK